MPLSTLLSPIPKDPNAKNWWTFKHWNDHLEIIQAIQKKTGQNLVRYIIDPMNPSDEEGWNLRHQQMHDDMNNILNIQGLDLSKIPNKEETAEEWAAIHFREHQQARLSLGI
jgi:hypothetical protein